MTNKRPIRKTYFTRNVGAYPDEFSFLGRKYRKIEDLRYGTNPHQTAAFYKPTTDALCLLSDMRILKSGKGGLSETNIEDISYALNILKYFTNPGAVIMKHLNPSGAAMRNDDEALVEIYRKARDCDSRAFFGGVVGFNVEVDMPTAEEIMMSYLEVVFAPAIKPQAIEVFDDFEKFKRNKHIRIVEVPSADKLPKYVGDETYGIKQVRILHDGTLIISDPFVSNVRQGNDFVIAEVNAKKKGFIKSEIIPTEPQRRDLVFAWHVLLNVRSNAAVIAKNGSTLAIGTGEQDRVGAVEQAIDKYKRKYKGLENLQGSVMVTDGYCPFPDVVEAAAAAGVSVVAFPAGSVKDFEVVKTANERGVAILFAPERCFSHH